MSWFSALPNADKLNQLASFVQTANEAVSTFNQLRQQFGSVDTGEPSMQRGLNELTFAEPDIGGAANQNLYEGFDREFLKKVALESPVLVQSARETDGCTPLLCAVKRSSLDDVVLLLAYGVDHRAADFNGNTALHHAIMAGSTRIVKLLLCFGADADVPNKAGKSASALKMNAELAEIISHQRVWNQYGVISAKTPKAQPELEQRLAEAQQQRSLHHQQQKLKAGQPRGLRLLSLDGGGVKGLVLIQILLELEQLEGVENKGKKQQRNFVQRNFDWLAGTSTGAILALALADGASLRDCLRLYLRLKDEIFSSPLRPYKSEPIEQFLRDQFGEHRKMADLRCGKMNVFVTATRAEQIPLKLMLFRSYRSPFCHSGAQAADKVCIWRAARCSSAAPTYFSSVDGIMDGGLMANNPSISLLREVYQHNAARQMNLIRSEEPPKELGVMLSLGTGRQPRVWTRHGCTIYNRIYPFLVPLSTTDVVLSANLHHVMQTVSALSNLKSMLVEQLATSDGEVVETARMLCHEKVVPYFRMTPNLHKDIQLDTVDNSTLVDMMWTTKVYVREECAEDVHALLTLLRQFEAA